MKGTVAPSAKRAAVACTALLRSCSSSAILPMCAGFMTGCALRLDVAEQEAPTEWGLGFLRTCSPRDFFHLLNITHPLVRGRAPVKESSQSWDDAPARQSPPLLGGGPFPAPFTGGSR